LVFLGGKKQKPALPQYNPFYNPDIVLLARLMNSLIMKMICEARQISPLIWLQPNLPKSLQFKTVVVFTNDR
jgi:hypothetical protein